MASAAALARAEDTDRMPQRASRREDPRNSSPRTRPLSSSPVDGKDIRGVLELDTGPYHLAGKRQKRRGPCRGHTCVLDQGETVTSAMLETDIFVI
jgi:hypothetical protein